MNDKKILFFDIDGTLLTPHPFKVPESTSRALTKAHENGHLLFINTGRTKVMMPSALSELHFDGYMEKRRISGTSEKLSPEDLDI